MNRKFSTIYYNSPSSQDNTEKSEEKSISYWLQRLHKQEENRVEKENEKEQRNGSTNGAHSNLSISRSPQEFQENEKTLQEKGKDEQTKNQASKTEADKQLTNRLVKSSNRCIMSISSAFPWNFFPSTINIEENRVTFTFRQFLSSQSQSVDIKDISNVYIESSFFYATLQIISRTFGVNDFKIENLNKKEAGKARMIIEGLRTLLGHDIDTSIYTVDELLSKVEKMQASQVGQFR